VRHAGQRVKVYSHAVAVRVAGAEHSAPKAVLNSRAVKARYAPKQSLEARLPVFGRAPKGGPHELLGQFTRHRD
jgi:hypothetical protein